MELSGINGLLDLYRKRLFKAEDERKALIETIKNISGIDLPEAAFTFKNKTAFIKTDPVTRNQLFIYKEKILQEIAKTAPNTIFDIK